MKPNCAPDTALATNKLRDTLQQLMTNNPQSLIAEVASSALYYTTDSPDVFFRDLLNNGCSSGMVYSLVYYCDTHAFYDHYYHDIEGLRLKYEEDIGQPLSIQGDLKNFFAWFAFEETAYRLAVDQLKLDL